MVRNQLLGLYDYKISFTDTGYKVEYQFAFNESFASADKIDRIIGFGAQINDDTDNNNKAQCLYHFFQCRRAPCPPNQGITAAS